MPLKWLNKTTEKTYTKIKNNKKKLKYNTGKKWSKLYSLFSFFNTYKKNKTTWLSITKISHTNQREYLIHFPPSYNSHHPGRVRAILWSGAPYEISKAPNHILSNRCVTKSESQRWLWLTKDWKYGHTCFFPLTPNDWWLWHHQGSNSYSPNYMANIFLLKIYQIYEIWHKVLCVLNMQMTWNKLTYITYKKWLCMFQYIEKLYTQIKTFSNQEMWLRIK